MKIRHVRLLALAAVSASFTLLWALPAVAHPSAKPTTVNVTAGKPAEFGFIVSPKSVKHGVPVTFVVTNKGVLPHTFKICSANNGTAAAISCTGKTTPQINAGKSASLPYTFAKAGKYEYLCTIPGHAAGGMKGVLTVT
jgi:uncharacterized cupredoxin-like copper-binding protein